MATYKVTSDGTAPKGLRVGSNVVTWGGTYQVTGVNADGTYKSTKISDVTPGTYTGTYATPGQSAATSTTKTKSSYPSTPLSSTTTTKTKTTSSSPSTPSASTTPKYTATNTSGGTYSIGTDKGINFIENAAAGSKLTGGDNSTWYKGSDGSVTITHPTGTTYTVAGNLPSTQDTVGAYTYPTTQKQTGSASAQSGAAPTLTAQDITNALIEAQSVLQNTAQPQSNSLSAADIQSLMDYYKGTVQRPTYTAAPTYTSTVGSRPTLTNTWGNAPIYTSTAGDRPELVNSWGSAPAYTPTVGDRPELNNTWGDAPEYVSTVGDRPELVNTWGDAPEYVSTVGEAPVFSFDGERPVYTEDPNIVRPEYNGPSGSIDDNVPAPEYEDAPEYTNRYDDRIQALIDQILNREAFSYDPEEDLLYQQYRSAYRREGNKAMQDTLGQLSARTGGLANSWAGSMAQQVNNSYAAAVADKIPELYQLAYNMYLSDAEQQMRNLGMLNDAENSDYARYRNAYTDWANNRDFQRQQYLTDVSNFLNDRNFAQNQYQTAMDDYWNERNLDWQKHLTALDSYESDRAFAQGQYDRERANWENDRNFEYNQYLNDYNNWADNRAFGYNQYLNDLSNWEDDRAFEYNKYLNDYTNWENNRSFGYNSYLNDLSNWENDRAFDYNQYLNDYANWENNRAFGYNQYRDELADWQSDRAFDYNKYLNDYNNWADNRAFGYNRYLNDVANWENDRTFEYNKYLNDYNNWANNRAFEYGQYRDDASDFFNMLGITYDQYRDLVSDSRFDTQWNYNVGRDEASDARYRSELEYARQQDEYNRQQTEYARQQAEQSAAQSRINSILAAGGSVTELPSELVTASGMTQAELSSLSQYYLWQLRQNGYVPEWNRTPAATYDQGALNAGYNSYMDSYIDSYTEPAGSLSPAAGSSGYIPYTPTYQSSGLLSSEEYDALKEQMVNDMVDKVNARGSVRASAPIAATPNGIADRYGSSYTTIMSGARRIYANMDKSTPEGRAAADKAVLDFLDGFDASELSEKEMKTIIKDLKVKGAS